MLHPIRTLVEEALALLFPDRCVSCARTGPLLCPACREQICPLPASDGGLDGRARSLYLDAMTAPFGFDGPLREAIHALKYERIRRIAPLLGDLLATSEAGRLLPADALVPVPLHSDRLRERGFNQSELLAHRLAQVRRLPLLSSSLVRQRDTAHQIALGARARRENVAGAFGWQHPDPPPSRVLLIDDVLTTGATFGACAQALRDAGAREVRALALARGQFP